jgi:hypothetical protein
MPQDIAFTVAAALRLLAAERSRTPKSRIADCVLQHLKVAIRHQVLVERLEQVDAAILARARAVDELNAAADEFASKIPHFQPIQARTASVAYRVCLWFQSYHVMI